MYILHCSRQDNKTNTGRCVWLRCTCQVGWHACLYSFKWTPYLHLHAPLETKQFPCLYDLPLSSAVYSTPIPCPSHVKGVWARLSSPYWYDETQEASMENVSSIILLQLAHILWANNLDRLDKKMHPCLHACVYSVSMDSCCRTLHPQTPFFFLHRKSNHFYSYQSLVQKYFSLPKTNWP